jgi:uncharacterized protein (TIGR02391 family)
VAYLGSHRSAWNWHCVQACSTRAGLARWHQIGWSRIETAKVDKTGVEATDSGEQRLADLALDFHEAPDRVLLDGFRRLEDRIRDRTWLAEHGAKLFSQAFAGDDSRLVWNMPQNARGSKPDPIEKGEQAGRAQLFTGAYQAFRNPRAHRTLNHSAAEALSEFLMLNQLFRFEAEAVERPATGDPDGAVSKTTPGSPS